MEVLLLAMKEETADAAHLARACAVLWSLAMMRGAPETMAKAGAVNALFDALQLHPADAHLQHLGLMAAQVYFARVVWRACDCPLSWRGGRG